MIEESKYLYLDSDYQNWISELSQRYRRAQIKAAMAVNSEMLQFYWDLGKEIVSRQDENKYGTGFFERLSRDLKEVLPEAKGFSVRNLKYIKRFFLMYSSIWQQVVAKNQDTNQQQVVADLFKIPWGHHTLLIDQLEKFIPEDFKSALPSIDEIEAKLSLIERKEEQGK